ncbi:UcrQ family protein [Gilbertella persicaria]|uniref:UcrQ family protein n=1 Tax=Gilbertella persicaria TaxID=101096 RepID=UPI00221E3E80|nr:UcrQ family protein [Gilbertella persicaria]KAI8051378.1 UcrQ family protein [Gilbertella persicaria]
MGGAKAKTYMGWWGHMGGPTQRGVVTYLLSPFEQKPFAGAAHNAVFNTARRVTSQVPYVGVAFGLGYFIYTSAKSRHAYLTSKAGHAAEGGDH